MNINKRGSYIVEAAISLPLFIIAIVVLMSIILMYSCLEDSEFIMATEMRRASAESIWINDGPLLPERVIKRTKAHSQVELIIPVDYGYRVSRWEIDELILLSMNMRLNTRNPIGLASTAQYKLSGVTRAYVGRKRVFSPMPADEFEETGDEIVYIFPKFGERYHKERCTYVVASCRTTILSSSIKRRYSACPVCRSGSIETGSLVYIFPKEGEAYHLPTCDTLKRNCIEVMKRTARKRHYTACSKCGG